MDHIYIACLRMYFLNYLDSYHYTLKLWHVSSAIAETAETADVELDQEKWADDVPDLKQEVWPDTVPDLQPEKWHDAMPGLKPEESAHAFGDLKEVADFEEESSHAFVAWRSGSLLTRWRTSRSRQTTRCRWTLKDYAILSP